MRQMQSNGAPKNIDNQDDYVNENIQLHCVIDEYARIQNRILDMQGLLQESIGGKAADALHEQMSEWLFDLKKAQTILENMKTGNTKN